MPGLPTATPSINPSATATSGDITAAFRADINQSSGAGQRGFQNIISFPGAVQTTTGDSINPTPDAGIPTWIMWAGGGLTLLITFFVARRYLTR